MNRKRTIKRAMVLGLCISGALGLNAWAQEAAFTNFVEGAKWSEPNNWDPNTVPGVGWTASLTNRTGAFAVDYAVDYDVADETFRDGALLNMIHTAPNTVTLNVNADMTPNASRFLLQMNAQSIVNVMAGNRMRFIGDGTAMSGQMNIYGEVVADMDWVRDVGPHLRGNWIVHDGGVLITDDGNGADFFWLDQLGTVVVESGGAWTNRLRNFFIANSQTAGHVALRVRGDFVHEGSRDFRLHSDGANSHFNYPVVRVEENGRFLNAPASEGMRIAADGSSHRRGDFYLTDNGSVTNWGYLHIGIHTHTRGTIRHGRLYIQGGQWVNASASAMTLIGGYPPSSTDYSETATTPANLTGRLHQTDGICILRGDVYVANGPSTGSIRVDGGDFFATNATGTTTLRVGSMEGIHAHPGAGTLDIRGGAVLVDQLIAINGADYSTILLTGGALTLGASTIDTGSALAVGNGAQPASLILLAGGHAIANGLTVNTNATLALRGLGAEPVTVGGNVTFEEDAVLQVAVTEAADLVNVTGSVTLNGALDVSPLNDYEPSDGAEWTVMSASGGITGSFASVTEGYKAEVLDGDTLVVMKSRAGTMLLIR